MTDAHQIPQWRRRIQPSRNKTPTPAPELDEAQNENNNILTSQNTRPRSRPRLSAYLTKHLSTGSTGNARPTRTEASNLVAAGIEYCSTPEIRLVVNCLTTRLANSPHLPLDVRLNSNILTLLEAYRDLTEEKETIQQQLEEENQKERQLRDHFAKAEQEWSTKEEQYKAEIKRLEILMAQGKSGLAAVLQARQDSIVKRKKAAETHCETHNSAAMDYQPPRFEALTQIDRVTQDLRQSRYSFQRMSPSRDMAALSRHFDSPTHQPKRLPGTPPARNSSQKLVGISRIQGSGGGGCGIQFDENVAVNEIASSEDASSTISSVADPLPGDENSNALLIASLSAKERGLMRRFASLVARRNGLADYEEAARHLMRLIQPISPAAAHGAGGVDISLPIPVGSLHAKIDHIANAMRSRSKRHKRVFSFQSGDDTGDYFSNASEGTTTGEPGSHQQCSSPLNIIELLPVEILSSPERAASLAAATTDAHETRRASLIPGPSREHSLARPRREDSNSSFLTAIQRSPMKHSRKGSHSSSRQSVVTIMREDTNPSGKSATNRPSYNCRAFTIEDSGPKWHGAEMGSKTPHDSRSPMYGKKHG